MSTVKAIIERTDKNYSAYVDGIDGVVATGSNVEEIKANLIDALNDYIDTCRELGCEIPAELGGAFNIEFKMDVNSFLSLYEGIFTKAGLERITGINQKQLWHYAKGISNPHKTQVLKIENALHRLGHELIALSF